MADHFDIGGQQDFIFRRVVNATSERLPEVLAADIAVSDMGGTTRTVLTNMANQLTSTKGFFSSETTAVTITINGMSTSTFELQVYNPLSVGAAAFDVGWQCRIPATDWVNGQAKTIMGPLLPWQLICTSFAGADTSLNVTIEYFGWSP